MWRYLRSFRRNTFEHSSNKELHHHEQMTPHGDVHLCQHKLWYRFVVWWYQSTTCNSVDLSTKVFCGIHMWAISQRVLVKFNLNIFRRLHFWNNYSFSQRPMTLPLKHHSASHKILRNKLCTLVSLQNINLTGSGLVFTVLIAQHVSSKSPWVLYQHSQLSFDHHLKSLELADVIARNPTAHKVLMSLDIR